MTHRDSVAPDDDQNRQPQTTEPPVDGKKPDPDLDLSAQLPDDQQDPSPYSRLFGPGDHPAARPQPEQHELPEDDQADDADEADDEPVARQRPRLATLILGAMLLVAIGGGLGLVVTEWGRSGGGNDQTIARVGDVAIPRSAFLQRWSQGQDPQQLLDDLIDIELLVQNARREGVTVDTAQTEQQIQQVRQQQGDQAAFNQFLASNGIPSEDALRELIERDQIVQTMVLKHTTVEQARARHILLGGDNPEAITARKAEAEELLQQLRAGADWSKLAGEKSDDPASKIQGGDLGWAPAGVFVPEFDQALFSMQPGELRLVQSEFGWHIIQLQDAPTVRALDNPDFLQTASVQQAINQTFLPWIKALRTEAEQAGQVNILVQAADLVPSPAP